MKRLRFSLPHARLISYPRSGRTWIAQMLTSVKNQSGMPGEEFLMKKHDGAMIQRRGSLGKYNSDKSFYVKNDVVLLARDPRDVVVSLYFMLVRRHANRPEGRRFSNLTIGEFARSDLGLSFVVQFLSDWARARGVPKKFICVCYEDFVTDAFTQLRRVVTFLSVNVSNRIIANAVDRCRFDRMRTEDERVHMPEFRLTSRQKEDPNVYSVRAGKVGDYKKWLEPEDVHWCDAYVRSHLNVYFMRYWNAKGTIHEQDTTL